MLIYLASQSPRRQELLSQIGVPFTLLKCVIDETPLEEELAMDYVIRMAKEKALAAQKILKESQQPGMPVLTADTSVILGKKILGKPKNPDHACDMLLALSGKCHEVITAVAVSEGKKLSVTHSRTSVLMSAFSQEQAEAYVATGEPLDKAGAYGIQGFGAVFVESINGSYSGVVGLPLKETADLLKTFEVNSWHSPRD